MKEIYLGDGAYAKFGGLDLIIYTSNGVHATNSVYLGPSEIRKLSEFISEILK